MTAVTFQVQVFPKSFSVCCISLSFRYTTPFILTSCFERNVYLTGRSGGWVFVCPTQQPRLAITLYIFICTQRAAQQEESWKAEADSPGCSIFSCGFFSWK